ncbi:MAG: Monosaccharide transporter rane protein family [Aeromicrobium sp.]|nr:Monosaccharide transporter rane protein family [Aeromicrobium sp.]
MTDAKPGHRRPTADRGGDAQHAAVTAAARRVSPMALFERFGIVLVWAAVAIGFAIAEPGTYLTLGNLANIFGSQAVLVVVTLALIIPLTAGDYDLSVGGTVALSSMTIAVLNGQHGWPIVAAVVVAILAGVVVGLFNGLVITIFGIDSLIVTLGTQTVLSGLVLWMSNSQTVSGVSNGLVSLVVVHKLFGIPLAFYYAILITLAIWYLFEQTVFGRKLLFTGRGRDVARLSGIRVSRLRVGALVCSGLVAALAGIVYVGTTGAADPSSGFSFLLPAFAAAFLGFTAIRPGRFNAWGTFVAVYFLISGITGLELKGVPPFVQQFFYGGALILAVVLRQVVRGRKETSAE